MVTGHWSLYSQDEIMDVIDEAIKCQASVVHVNTSAKGITVLGKALISF